MTKETMQEFMKTLFGNVEVTNDFYSEDHETFLNSFKIDGKPCKLEFVIRNERGIPHMVPVLIESEFENGEMHVLNAPQTW